jgi:hypothetical protein
MEGGRGIWSVCGGWGVVSFCFLISRDLVAVGEMLRK